MKLKNEKKKLDKKIQYIKYIYIYKYHFQQYETIRSFEDSIYNGKISIDEADIDQSS